MASQWHYQLGDQEMGPIAYSELIQLVCDGMVREEDLVHGEWSSDWQRADSVVGLFHMARRQKAEVEAREAEAKCAEESAEAASVRVHASSSRWRWLAWLLPGLSSRSVGSASSRSASVATVSSSSAAVADRPHRWDGTKSENGVAQPRGDLPNGQAAGRGTPVAPTSKPVARRDPRRPPGEAAVNSSGDETPASEEIKTLSPAETTSDEAPATSKAWASTVADALDAAKARDVALSREQEKEESRGRVRGSIGTVLGWVVFAVTRPVVLLFGWLVGVGGPQTRDRVAAGLSVLERWLPRPSILRIVFKLGAGIGTANLVAFGILRWSDRQALRFPSAESDAGRAFPLVGECGPAEFGFFVFQVTLLAGVAAYGIAAVLEANTDD